MPLDQMIDPKAQIQSVSELEQMIVQNNLPGQLKASLLSCKVDELSPATLRDYNQKLKALARFCVSVNVHDARAITASHSPLLAQATGDMPTRLDQRLLPVRKEVF